MRVSGPRLRLLTVLAVAAVASGASAQPGPPRFTAGIELARLDVEVTDAQGLPIRDLRADEVEVIEGGVRRPVALLRHVREPAGSYADAARRTIGGDVSTNQGAPRGRLYVFVFDQSHITPRNEQVARRAAAYEIGRGNQEILQQVLQRLARDRGPASGFAALDVRDAARSVASRADFQARQFLDTFADLIRGLDIRAFASRGGQQFTALQSRVSPLGTLAAETDGELFAQAARRLDPAARGRRQAIDAALAAPFALQGLRVDYTTYVLRTRRAAP